MTAHGFSLVELLVALTVCAVLSAAAAGIVPPARAAFDAAPAALDLQQRSRTAIDVLASAIRSAALAKVPAVIPLSLIPDSGDPDSGDPDSGDTEFEALYVIAPVPNGSQGVLDRDQRGAHGVMALASGPGCPALRDVCGFTPGAVAAIADGSGRFDVFIVASTNIRRGEITASLPFSSPYPSGSLVVEVEAQYFRLDDQDDGSRALVRETAGGATQPIVDHVTGMGIELWRDAPPILVSADDLDDGPFLAGGPEGSYDADLLAVRRIDVWISVEVPPVLLRTPTMPRTRMLRATFALRNAASRNLP